MLRRFFPLALLPLFLSGCLILPSGSKSVVHWLIYYPAQERVCPQGVLVYANNFMLEETRYVVRPNAPATGEPIPKDSENGVILNRPALAPASPEEAYQSDNDWDGFYSNDVNPYPNSSYPERYYTFTCLGTGNRPSLRGPNLYGERGVGNPRRCVIVEDPSQPEGIRVLCSDRYRFDDQ